MKDLWSPGVIAPDKKDPPANPYNGPTKTELMTEAVNTSNALHKDGSWYLIPAESWVRGPPQEADSIVMHVCSKSWSVKSKPDERGVERMYVQPYIAYRYNADEMNSECHHCCERPPESIVGLWTLHNWDYLCLNDSPA